MRSIPFARRTRLKAAITGLVGATFVAALIGGTSASAASGEEPDPPVATAADALRIDAERVAADYGITVEDALARLERQPRIGELQAAMYERGPASFGGLFIQQEPDYEITVLARPGRAPEVRSAVDALGFSDLEPFVRVKETMFTEDALERALLRVGQLAGGKATTLDVDLRAGEVRATAATENDAELLRRAVASATPPIQARQVVINIGGPSLGEHSYGGLALTTCTSGYSVRRTTDDSHGVSTAAHCQNSQTLQKHDAALDYVTGKEGDSQDVQWHKTPNLDDPAYFNPRDGSGSIRNVFSRTDRDQMSVGDSVCHSGMTSGGGCGEIDGRSFDPDGSGSAFNATFIRVRNDNTSGGDSGGPWFLGNSAYGTHRSSTTDGNDDPVFMAQNFMAALDLVVKVN